MACVVDIRHVSKYFAKVAANKDVSLTVDAGQVVALLGENGAGKSTIMKILYGLYAKDEGEILIDGVPQQIHSPKDAMACGIAMIQQHFSLVPTHTATENIILGNSRGLLNLKACNEKIEALARKYGFDIPVDLPVGKLAVGVQQKVEILKALYMNARILIMDEPTAVLTPQEIDELMQIMRNLAAEGKSILFISHKLNEIMAVADRCTVLRKGKYIGTVETANTTMEELSSMMVGRNVSFHVEKGPSNPGDVILSVEDLTVASKVHKNNAVKNASLKVRAGEIVCIAGIDGNGQTEFVHALTGLEPAVSGKITLSGRDITNVPIRQRSIMGMSHIPEDRHKHGLVLDYSLEDNMVLQRYFEPEFTDKAGSLRRDNILMAHKEYRLFGAFALPVKKQISVDLGFLKFFVYKREKLFKHLVKAEKFFHLGNTGM